MPNAENTSPNDARTLKRVFAADLGGTHLRSAIIDQTGKIGFRLKQRTPSAQKPEEIVDALVAVARECEQQNTTGECTIDAVSVVVPGTVNVASGVIVKAPNLSCLNGFHLTEALARVLKRPTSLANDATAAASIDEPFMPHIKWPACAIGTLAKRGPSQSPDQLHCADFNRR